MKKRYLLLFIPVILAALLLILYAQTFPMVRLESDITGAVVYRYGDISFEEPLSQEQIMEVVQIINGRRLAPQSLTGLPSCPFSENVAVILGERRFLMAGDDCAVLQDGETGRYFEISNTDRQALEAIFATHGGTFPCI